MLKRLCAVILVGCSAVSSPAAEVASRKLPQALRSAESVVWAGLDYSLVRMVGPGDFTDAAAIFPGMLDTWNSLFLVEMMDKARGAVGKPLTPDVAGVTARNRSASVKQVVPAIGPEDGTAKTHLTAEELAKAVRDCSLVSRKGVGLVFVVDRLVKPEQLGALYIVFFDVATREVLASERKIYKAGGFGFRNYWFRIPKSAVNDLKKLVQ
jgi:hypothetical protein